MQGEELGFSFIIKWDTQTRNRKKAQICQTYFMEYVPEMCHAWQK